MVIWSIIVITCIGYFVKIFKVHRLDYLILERCLKPIANWVKLEVLMRLICIGKQMPLNKTVA